MEIITPVILAGGSGTRLWPLSRKSYPKQFSELIGDRSLFQESAIRLSNSKIIKFSEHVTITNADFRFIISEQLKLVGLDPGSILIEPEGKNTAPAILAATLFAYRKDPSAIILVAPSDHIIPDVDIFHNSIKLGLSVLTNGQMCTFGISPTRPETGYGYLELFEKPEEIPVKLKSFIEKPDLARAEKMLQAKNFLWNAGIFLFRASDMLKNFERHAFSLIKPVKESLDKAWKDLEFIRLEEKAWSECESISIDYAIMEKTDNLMAISYSGHWSDLGGWDSIWQELESDTNGVVTSKGALAIDCKNVLLRSENKNQQLVGIGLEGLVAVAMPDAVLVLDKARAQDVSKAVQAMKLKDIAQAELFPKDHRPWGWFESLATGDSFQVKRIFVNPGAAISLQSHKYRSEHWVVVEGIATVTIEMDVSRLSSGQSIYVPLGAVHRLENLEDTPVVLIEVQTGSYLGEDDIIRYDDVYARS